MGDCTASGGLKEGHDRQGVEAVAAPVFNFKNELTMAMVIVGVEGSIDMGSDSTVIARLKDDWRADFERWQKRDLSARRYVYIWADGVYLQARMEPQAECMLVVIGATPEGFTEDKAFTKPPAGAVLRLVVFRKVKGVAGVRYQESDLRTGYVASGLPISRYEVADFQTGDVCGDDEASGDGSSTTTSTTLPGA